MKKLLTLLLIALPLAVKAQSTNVSWVLTIEEGTTRTNSFTNSMTQLQVTGLLVAYDSYKAASTNNTDTFRQFSRGYFRTLATQPLTELGKAHQLNAAKIDKIQQSIAANWENASAADRKLLTDWLDKYPPAP